MAYDSLVLGLLMVGCSIQALSAASEDDSIEYMNREEREALKFVPSHYLIREASLDAKYVINFLGYREEARDMFYHAYNAYMDNAYPADELMPLSCKGRYRGSEPNRGDIDSTLGNFSLTLVDTLDTLVVLGDLEEFENAVKLVARDVSFDTDVIVSLFETNIRMLGGLLSGHILAEYLQQRADIMPWYRGELLNLAKDLGYRFLPAFNTTTGIPYGRINLKHGMKGVPMEISKETCTACAGSMILEMAALSRLTGESIFEEKAQKAMDVLWKMRHRGTDLMGSVLNVNSGDWVRRDSGVGAGIDSYYEYCLKAYILLGDEKYLGRFNKHYQAVMKYVSQGPMLLDVHMHRPNTNSKNFMDALLAFWPGLQVLKGDIKPAVETHEMLYQVMQRHNFIPEAFTTDFQVHWGHHPLRPEFLESTYFLYRATGDHYYLEVGRKVLKSLQTYARVPCGYAAVSDVRTNTHDDTMDSFVLSETFKYLFLLFAEPNELVLDLDEFIFTTEGHLLPLTLASIRTNISSEFERDVVHVDDMDRTCPNSLHLFPASVRQPLRNMVEDVCPRRTIRRRLSAAQFQANNLEHLKMLSDMGITTLTLADGRVQLSHTFFNAKTLQDSEEGLLFMQEMLEIIKMQSQQTEIKPQAVTFVKPNTHPPQKVMLLAGPALFGLKLQDLNKVTGKAVFTHPSTACTDLINSEKVVGKIAIVDRGNCMFIEKARRIQQAGAIAGIVLDNVDGYSAATSSIFAMSGDGKEVDDVVIPVVFLFSIEAAELMKAITAANGDLTVTLVAGNFFPNEEVQLKAPTDLSVFERIKGSLKSFLTRQMTPQTSANNRANLDATVPEIQHQEEEKNIVILHDLHAEIIRDPLGGEVRITSSDIPAPVTRKSEDKTTVEKEWHELKEVFVNQIYSNVSQTGIQIRSFILENYYNWIIKSRGGDENKLVSLRDKISWFLEELAEVTPNPSIVKMDQLMDSNKRRILKQYILTKMDIMILNMKTTMTLLKTMKLESPNPEQLMKLVDLNIEQAGNYHFLKQLLSGISETEDEDLNEHQIRLNDINRPVHKEFVKIVSEGAQGSLGKTAIDKNLYYDIIIDGWQRDVKNFKKLDVLRRIGAGDHAIAKFLGDSNESGKNELTKSKDSIKLNKNENTKNGKLEDFEQFILTEIKKAVKNFEKTTLRKDTAEDKSKEINNSNKVIVNVSSQNQSKDDKLKGKVKYQIEFLKNKLEDFMKDVESMVDFTKSPDPLPFQETFDERSKKQIYEGSLNDFQISDAPLTSEAVDTKKSNEKDRLQKILEEINFKSNENDDLNTEQSIQSDRKNDRDVSSYPLEKFQQSTWFFDEEKGKSPIELKRESERSNVDGYFTEESEVQDRKKYIVKIESNEAEIKSHDGKHIDEL